MTLPPHGPPEITEAQQAATSLGEVEDPTPDNVSRALQDYSPYAVAAAAAALGATGGGGGGSQPTTREEWSGNAVTLAAPNTFDWLPWSSSGGPDAVLDATDPVHPTIITAGVYVVSVVVICSGADDSHSDVSLYLDRSGFNASQQVRTIAVPTGASTGQSNNVTIAFAWYIPAGGKVEVGVDYTTGGEQNGSASLLIAHLQRLS